jgi:hypothetical protein
MIHSLLRQHFNKFLLALLVSAQVSVFAQPAIQWDKTIGGNNEDRLNSVQQTLDGGYILGGTSYSDISGDKTDAARGASDYWIVKLAADGTKQWDRTLGGAREEIFYAIRQANDGSYFVAGQSFSGISGDKIDINRGIGDLWIVKLSATGSIMWQKSIGTEDNEFMSTMEITPDGGLAIAGTFSPDGYDGTTSNRGWFVKLNAMAEIQWSKEIFVDRTTPRLTTLTLTSDGGYLVGANIGGIEDRNGGYYLVRMNSAGNTLWIRNISGGGDENSSLKSVVATPDGGYVLGGTSGAIIGADKSENSLSNDYWIVKITSDGTIQWEQTIQASEQEEFAGIQLMKGGGYLVAGSSTSPVGYDKRSPNSSYYNFWLVGLSQSGAVLWDKVIGGNEPFASYDGAKDLISTSDGGFLIGGNSTSPVGGDKTEPSRGGSDYWIVKLAPENPPLPQTTIRINAGGPDFTTATKKLFIADKYYAGIDRTSSIASGDILNTTNDVLYRSGRSSPSFNYNIPVQNGQVNVTLHFAETYFGVPSTKGGKGGAGSRRFHVNMEGSRKLTNYDIFAQAGGALRANQITFPVTVTDGVLNIDFLTGAADQPRVGAIEVVATNVTLSPLADAFVWDGSYSATNFGTSPTLEIKYYPSSVAAIRASYLKFQLPMQTSIISAKLRVYGHNHENSNDISLHAYGVNNDSWIETTINKVNAPAASTASLGYVAVNNVYKYYEIDVTSYVKAQQQSGDGLVSLLLNDPNNRNTRLIFNSKENGANPPQLIVQTAPVTVSNTREGVKEVIAEKEAIEVNIFPNPASEILNIEVVDWHKVKSVELLNSRSNVVYHSGVNPVQSVDVKELPTGIYLVRIGMVDGSAFVRKVLVGK